MDGEKAVKNLVEGKPGGEKKIGKPIFRWLDDVEGLEEFGSEYMENKSFGQNSMGIHQEES
jgi:hypothetical protein